MLQSRLLELTSRLQQLETQNQRRCFTSGTQGANLKGGDGKNTLIGGAGTDMLTGGAKADTLTGGAGIDTFVGSGGADIMMISLKTMFQ